MSNSGLFLSPMFSGVGVVVPFDSGAGVPNDGCDVLARLFGFGFRTDRFS